MVHQLQLQGGTLGMTLTIQDGGVGDNDLTAYQSITGLMALFGLKHTRRRKQAF
jgi:hypothetical protein